MATDAGVWRIAERLGRYCVVGGLDSRRTRHTTLLRGFSSNNSSKHAWRDDHCFVGVSGSGGVLGVAPSGRPGVSSGLCVSEAL